MLAKSRSAAALLVGCLSVVLAAPPAANGASSGSFSPTGSMGTVRRIPSAAPIPGGVLVVGGENEVGNPETSAEVYDPTTGTFGPTAGSMGTARQGPVAGPLSGGRVLVAGGIGPSMNFLDTAEVYDAATGTFSPTGSMGIERFKAAAAPLPDGRILVTGGRAPDNGGFVNLATAEVFDPFTNTFSPTGSMSSARWGPAAAPLPDGRVLVAGGIAADNTTVLPTAEVYDPATGTFTPTGSMGVGRRFFAASPLPGGDVLVTGGDSGTTELSSAEVYDPSTGTFTSQGVGSMGTPREGPAAAPLPDGRVLMVGGYNGSARLDTAEIFTPDIFQPDAMIRLRGGAPRGDDVYNEDGSGQVRSTRAGSSQAKRFSIIVENDGNVPDSYTVRGPGGSSKRWVVRYTFGGLNVTSAVRKGSFDFKGADFAPGEAQKIKLTIQPTDAAKPGARKSVRVTVTSDGDGTKDTVRARVTVKKG